MSAPRRYVALEEHCLTPSMAAAHDKLAAEHGQFQSTVFTERLLDIDTIRLAAMDAAGVDVQVLSHHSPGAQLDDPAAALAAARAGNDEMAAAIARHPTRFAGFATLPTADPAASAAELRRCVDEHGFVGAMIHGQTGGGFIDGRAFDPVFAAAVDLDVPIYLHPTEPTDTLKDAYYRNLDVAGDDVEALQHMFATAGWGWHVETGTHALRMILGGVFDRHPALQVILGHWGELIPFYLGRIDQRLTRLASHLKHPPTEYFANNFHITPGGMETLPPLLLTISTVGVDRIMYSADYPFGADTLGRAYIDGAPISDHDKARIAHLNAERLLRLP
jgi:predicted TIM-barrel fold metal-dependent hydrolase